MSEVVLRAPFAGWLAPLDEVADPVFAERMMGEGVAIDPLEGVLRAPAEATVIGLPDSRHAVTLRLANDVELLLHIGLDTVGLGGAGFEARVAVGDRVSAGAPLIAFDLDAVAQQRDLITPIVVLGDAAFAPAPLGRVVSPEDEIGRVRGTASAVPVGAEGETLHRALTVLAPHGLHARPAARIVALLKSYTARVTVARGERTADGRSTVALMALAAKAGDTIRASATGVDAAVALDALEAFAAQRFGDAADGPSVQPAAARSGGICAVPGLAIGRITQFRLAPVAVRQDSRGAAQETVALDDALRIVADHMGHAGVAGAIAEAHRALLDDPMLRDAARTAVAAGESAGVAWQTATRTAAAALGGADDPLIAERIADLRDLERQVLVALSGEAAALPSLPADAILVAADLLPSQFQQLDRERLAGICTAAGGPTAHVAILAAAAGVPMIVAAGGAVLHLPDGATGILDADAATLIANPEPDQLAVSGERIAATRGRHAAAVRAAHDAAVTADGTPIEVFANLGSVDDAAVAVKAGAEGCGLLRTEFLFLDRQTPPDEAEQRALYARIATTLGDRPLIVRTLDIGGDKPVAYLPTVREDNPALGQRGIRLSLARRDLLATQLRAIVAGIPGGQCRIMLPMIVEPAELRAARAMLDEALSAVGRTDPVELGVMIETPAAALLTGQLAEQADFLSIGTNDLTQYALAADRGNPAVSGMVDALHPAVLRLIRLAAEGAARHGRWLGVCGGLASEPKAAPLLVGLGATELSGVPSVLAEVKASVRGTTMAAARALADRALAATSAGEVRAMLEQDW